jgi:hypothetical protein
VRAGRADAAAAGAVFPVVADVSVVRGIKVLSVLG